MKKEVPWFIYVYYNDSVPEFLVGRVTKILILNFNDALEKSGSLSDEIVIDEKYKRIKS